MTTFEYYSLIISFFTALGTCGATALALFFWLNGKKMKLGFHSMHGNTYGLMPNVVGGYFVASITNRNNFPIIIDKLVIGVCVKKWFTRQMDYYLIANGAEAHGDSLPKKLEFGERYVYARPATEIIRNLNSLRLQEKIEISDIKFIVCIQSEKNQIIFNIDKYPKSILLGGRDPENSGE